MYYLFVIVIFMVVVRFPMHFAVSKFFSILRSLELILSLLPEKLLAK